MSLSSEKYDDKNAIDWSKVKYNRIDDLTLNDIGELITDGYCYTSIFKKDSFNVFQKTETNWMGTDFVIFDVDNIKNEITFDDYLKTLKYTPTIAYTTPNCNKRKQNELKPFSRFRLLYAFDTTITDKWQYQGIYETIQNTFDTSIFDTTKKFDDSAKSPVQQFSGNATKNCQIVINDVIYNTKDFDIIKPIEKPIKIDNIKVKIKDEFIQNLNSLKPSDFLSYYSEEYEILFETELKYNDDGFALIPANYVRIQRNYTIYKEDGQIRSKYKRLKDGEKRRHSLFCNAKIRCQIKPNISIEELIYNLVYDRQHFYDNKDGVLSNQTLLRIALDAKKATYQMIMKKKPRFQVDDVFCRENNIKRKAQANYVRRKLNFDEISKWYDTTKRVMDNLKFAKENNIKVSRATLYHFCNEMAINPKGEPTEKPQNKAQISDISSETKHDGTTRHTEDNNATQSKYKPINLTDWVINKDYRNKPILWKTFYEQRQIIMSLKMAI